MLNWKKWGAWMIQVYIQKVSLSVVSIREQHLLYFGIMMCIIILYDSGYLIAEIKAFLDYVAGKKPDDSFVKKLEEAVKKAKENREWRHEYMTLWMRDQENIEKGREQGLIQGREQGKISGMLAAYREVGMTDDIISKKIQEKFHLSEEEVEEYLMEIG